MSCFMQIMRFNFSTEPSTLRDPHVAFKGINSLTAAVVFKQCSRERAMRVQDVG